ncbi:MAG: hypothetical protein ACR2NP_20640, partial [Pirellulaceae bacterium]
MAVSRRRMLGATALGLGGLGMARLGMANVNETANISEADLQEFTDKSRAAIKKGTGWLIK